MAVPVNNKDYGVGQPQRLSYGPDPPFGDD